MLDTSKQLGNKSDHYFIVGMTHEPDELRYGRVRMGVWPADTQYSMR